MFDRTLHLLVYHKCNQCNTDKPAHLYIAGLTHSPLIRGLGGLKSRYFNDILVT